MKTVSNILRKFLFWKKSISLDEAVSNLIGWYRANSDRLNSIERIDNKYTGKPQELAVVLQQEYDALIADIRTYSGVNKWFADHKVEYGTRQQVVFTRPQLLEFLNDFNVEVGSELVDIVFPPVP